MVDIQLTADTEDINSDVLNNSWVHGKLIHIDNKAEENYDQIKQHLITRWGGGVRYTYYLPNNGRNDSIHSRYEYSSGGSFGDLWPKITTPWVNRRVVLRTVSRSYTLNTDSNGITQGSTGQNQLLNYPISVELENEPNTRLRIEHGRRIVIYKAIEENDTISVWTNVINMGVKIVYHNGRTGFGVTDINGFMSIKNKTNRDDQNRWIKAIPMVGTSYVESYPFPITYSYQGHVAMFDNIFNDTAIYVAKDVNKGPTIFNIISIEVNGTVKTITLNVTNISPAIFSRSKLYLLDEISGIQVEVNHGMSNEVQNNRIVAVIDTPTNILRIRIKKPLSNHYSDIGKYYHGVPTSVLL